MSGFSLRCFAILGAGATTQIGFAFGFRWVADRISQTRLIAASQIQASANASDLLGSQTLDPTSPSSQTPPTSSAGKKRLTGPFNSVIAIGVLIKGSTNHYEYICDAVSHGLMRVQLDTGVPVIFGVLTCLTEDQAKERAGFEVNGKKGHNHGVDWAAAAVEQGVKTKRWAQGTI
jgi:6,7-dimethyl-8-ribityllumazine synthase